MYAVYGSSGEVYERGAMADECGVIEIRRLQVHAIT